jgi:hypothetical protein
VGAPLLALMRSVDPTNAFGIQQAHPAGPGVRIAVKNGWTVHGSSEGTVWNVNCLGIWGAGNRWVLAVTTRFPATRGSTTAPVSAAGSPPRSSRSPTRSDRPIRRVGVA